MEASMAKKKNKHILPNGIYADLGTPETQARVTFEQVKTDLGYANRLKDQRPIDKYYRWYCEDEAKDIADKRCRGINHDQYRIADRLYGLFVRMQPSLSYDLAVIPANSKPEMFMAERCMQAVHHYRSLMDLVNEESQRILEAICCVCHSLGDYEKQRQWRKGYAIIRLREALDEMNTARKRKR
jgi:hypothetical protein